MPIFEMTSDKIITLTETTFSAEGVQERKDLQRLLKTQIEIIAQDILIIAEEFSDWEDSKRRIDLLGLDKDANLVVFELKRTEDGGHMELQAIRYAAMVSSMTFNHAVDVYADYLRKNGREADALTEILQFLDWSEPDDDKFNKDVRIVLVSAEFSTELTTAVLWLNDRDLDIRCIRIKPYKLDGRLLVDVQQVIPLPEAAAYIVHQKEKTRTERRAVRDGAATKDLRKFDVTIYGVVAERLAKRKAILRIVKHLCDSGIPPQQIADSIQAYKAQPFQSVEGEMDAVKFVEQAGEQARRDGRSFEAIRWFCDPDELIFTNGRTYALSSQWGTQTENAIEALITAFPDKGVSCQPSDAI